MTLTRPQRLIMDILADAPEGGMTAREVSDLMAKRHPNIGYGYGYGYDRAYSVLSRLAIRGLVRRVDGRPARWQIR